jgi:hypothetical protein
MPDRSLLVTLAVFLGQCLVFSGAGVAAQLWRRRLTGRGSTALEAILLGALAPCALGYVAFALYFAHPLLGRAFSWLSLAVILGTLAHAYLLPLLRVFPSPTLPVSRSPYLHYRLLALPALAGVFYLSALFVFPHGNITPTAGQRFQAGMPGDNFIPAIFAERLAIGMSPKALGGDWLSSDRPPLQTGLILVTLPALRALDISHDKACATAGIWFQLLWIPALWVFLRWLGLTEHRAHAATAALVFTGFLLFNSVFVWPKLAGAALVLLAFCTFFATEAAIDPRHRWLVGGALAALGSLAHGGVMFSLLALAPIVAFSLGRRWRSWLLAAAAFVVLSLPWFAYQHFYEPPGNRLIKWHIAGTIAPDSRGVVATLVANYRAQGWVQTVETRRTNLKLIFQGNWHDLLTTRHPVAIADRRGDEIFHPFAAAAAWLLGAAALPLLLVLLLKAHRWKFGVQAPAFDVRHSKFAVQSSLAPWVLLRRHALAVAWLALTLTLWLALMFLPFGTLAHQGSYVVQLILFALLVAWTLLLSRRLFALLAAFQLAHFVLTWMPSSPAVAHITPQPFAIAVAGVTALLIATMAATALFPSPRSSVAYALPLRLFAWFKHPTLTPTVLAVFAIALFLRKPYALLSPQLYAEDGSIFLAQNDLVGLRALIEPYMGYLHTLPRLIASLASSLLDPAWWPAFYNATAFALWLAVVARTFSSRLPLPAVLRPWLALAFFLGPHSGEILFNITNLQWIVAFLLIQQAFISAPTTIAQRITDLALLLVLGLTGPFVIALGPLLAWRWWRTFRHSGFHRSFFDFQMLALATLCAAVQAWFVLRTGPHFTFPPFVASRFFEVIGQRLLLWPVLGDNLARHLAPPLLIAFGIVPVGVLLVWSLRPHPRQLLRAQLVAAFLLLMAAGVYRARPDTWNLDNLVFSDRYFYLPRVLLAWLFILELDTAQRAIAWTARVLLLACAFVHLKGYSVRAEPDYHWADHVEPIRRGIPANIPTLPEGWTLEYRGRPAAK